jgi:hypothetical protein
METFIAVLKEIMFAFAGSAPLAVAGIFLGKHWIEKRVEHEYGKKMADYESALSRAAAREQEQREIRYRAALISDLLSTWLAGSPATGGVTDYEKLNRLSFEAFLWLPQDIATELSKTLTHADGALSARDLIVRVRKYLLGDNDSLPAAAVITFYDHAAAVRRGNEALARAANSASQPN